MSLKTFVSTLMMSKWFSLSSSLYLYINFFQSSYGHPSMPVADLFFTSFIALLMLFSNISLFMGEFLGSSNFWEAGIVSSSLSICATLVSLFWWGVTACSWSW